MTTLGRSVVLIALLIVALLFWGGYELLKSPASTTTTASATSTVSSTILPGVSDATYVNHQLSFSIRYPSTASSSPTDFSGYLPLTQTPVASFALPQTMFSGTNLGEADVYIGATTTPTIMRTCQSAQRDSGEQAVGTTTIDGQDFATFAASDAGAGNLYESKIFRTYQNGVCLEIVEMLHSGNIANYPQGSVTQFDKTEFQGILDAIVQTYHPIPTGV